MKSSLYIFIYFVAVFLSYSAIAQEHRPRFDEIDVLSYQFNIKLYDSTDVIHVEEIVDIQFKLPVKRFYLDLVGSAQDSSGMTVHSVSLDGVSQGFTQSGERLVINSKQPFLPGSPQSFQISYSGTPADGLIIGDNKNGDRTFFGDNWPDRARHWLATVDHPSDKAIVEFNVEAPGHYGVIANGEKIGEINSSGGRKKTSWKTTKPIATKVAVIGVAPFAIDSSPGEVEGIPVSTWVYAKDREVGFAQYRQASEILAYLVDLLGPYPYAKLANVQSKTQYGGMENASNVFYREIHPDDTLKLSTLIAHEIAHQWFGNSVTEGNWHHIWLSEGMATYMTNRYTEDKYGVDLLRDRMKEQRVKVIKFSRVREAPVIDSLIQDYRQLLNPNSYQKGSWVLHMLRHQLGDEYFDQGIREYYSRFRGSNAVTSDLREVMEEVSGQDLSGFFRQWLYQSGHPKLKINWTQESKEVALTVKQLQGDAFTFPLEMVIHITGNIEKRIILDLEKSEHEFRIPVTGKVLKIEIDPEVKLFFELIADY